MSEPSPSRCPRCNASVAADQEYCLECGSRLARGRRSGQGVGLSAGSARRNVWVVPVFLGLVIAVFGTGAAIAISGEREEPTAVSTATGGSLTVTDDGSTLTAPEATAQTKTAPPTSLPRRPPRNRLQPPRRLPGLATGAAGRSCSSRCRRRTGSRLRPRRPPRPAGQVSVASAYSTPAAMRASTPATTFSSSASSSPRRRRRACCSERGRCSRPRISARSSPGGYARCRKRRSGGDAVETDLSRPDSLTSMPTIVNDFVTGPRVRILVVDTPRRNLIFGLYMGQNRER